MHLRYHCNGPASSLLCLGDRMAFPEKGHAGGVEAQGRKETKETRGTFKLFPRTPVTES